MHYCLSMVMNEGESGSEKEKCKTKITFVNSQHNDQPVFAGIIIFIAY